MTEIIKGTSAFGNYLLMTRANAERLKADKNGLKFYSTDTISEFDQVMSNLGIGPKLELFSGLNKSGHHNYDGFLRSEFQYGFLQLYVTGYFHYTTPSFMLKQTNECNYYLAPAIYVLQYPSVNYMDFSYNVDGVEKYIEDLNVTESEAASLVEAFYENTRNIYSGVRVKGSSKKTTSLQDLKDVLTLGDAVVIRKYRSLFAPFENIISTAVGVKVLKSRNIGDQCEAIDVFIIRCEHYGKGREFQLDVINNPPNLDGCNYYIEVVAQTDKPETVVIEYDKPPCIRGDNECPSILVDGGEYLNQRFTESPVNLMAKPYQKKEDLGFWDFMQSSFLPDIRSLDPEIYTITTDGCSDISEKKAIIHCYPTLEWNGTLTASMEHKYNEVGLLEDREFSFGGEIKYVRDGNTTTFGGKSTSTNNKEVSFPRLESLLASITSKMDDIKNKNQEAALKKAGKTLSGFKQESGSNNLVNVEIKPPKIELGGGVKLAESSKTGKVGMEGSVSLDLAPLIGMTVDTDLLDWLIMTFSGGLGTFLLKVKGLAARSKAKQAEITNSGVLSTTAKEEMNKQLKDKEGKAIFDAELYVKFIVDGSIAAKCEWKKDVDNSWLSVEGDKTASASAKITFKLEAVAKAKAEAFCVKISVGAEMHVAGVKSSAEGIGLETTLFATTAENKPALGGNIRFTGMAIYFTSWAEAGIKAAESDGDKEVPRSRKGGKSKKNSEVNLNSKKEYEFKTTIFDGSTWPDSKSQNSLDKTEL